MDNVISVHRLVRFRLILLLFAALTLITWQRLTTRGLLRGVDSLATDRFFILMKVCFLAGQVVEVDPRVSFCPYFSLYRTLFKNAIV